MTAKTEMSKYPIGNVVSVPMGEILPHAIEVKSFYTYLGPYLDDNSKQLVVSGISVPLEGHSRYRLNEKIEFCIYHQ